MLEYKGYVGQVEFDDSIGIFHGRVINTRDIITFEGTTVKEIQEALRESVDDYLEWCAERGDEPDKPFSGKFTVRIEPELHRKIHVQAQLDNQSVNAWVAETLESAATSTRKTGQTLIETLPAHKMMHPSKRGGRKSSRVRIQE